MREKVFLAQISSREPWGGVELVANSFKCGASGASADRAGSPGGNAPGQSCAAQEPLKGLPNAVKGSLTRLVHRGEGRKAPLAPLMNIFAHLPFGFYCYI